MRGTHQIPHLYNLFTVCWFLSGAKTSFVLSFSNVYTFFFWKFNINITSQIWHVLNLSTFLFFSGANFVFSFSFQDPTSVSSWMVFIFLWIEDIPGLRKIKTMILMMAFFFLPFFCIFFLRFVMRLSYQWLHAGVSRGLWTSTWRARYLASPSQQGVSTIFIFCVPCIKYLLFKTIWVFFQRFFFYF